MKLKALAKAVTPPIIWELARHWLLQVGRPEWEYIPEGWERARHDARIKGWNEPSVLQAYLEKWPGFNQNIAGAKPLGLSPEAGQATSEDLAQHNTFMVFGYCLALAARQKNSLSLLDWGGGIGHYYLISRALLPDVAIDYHCKDVSVLAEHGRTLLPEAHFYTDESCLQRRYDFVLASGSLHYSEDWSATLRGLAHATGGYLLVTRLPTIGHAASYVFVQRPYRYGYRTEYLGWCLNRRDFIEVAQEAGLSLMREFLIGERPPIHGAPEPCEYRGFLFRMLR
ncbi:MAG: hypothetical protein RMK99_04600 [Anaerolineales bacterium]|nr:hypothetical protein [Anaerolineales bacterium]